MRSTMTGRLDGLPMEIDFGRILSQSWYDDEIKLIFKRAWLPIGHTTAIPEPGDFFVRKLPGFDLSLLVVRGRDGEVRVFHNVCRHRGFQVECAENGRKRGFKCGFHGWSYNNLGELVGVTDAEQFHGLNKKNWGLSKVHSTVWNTFIFINLAPEPEMTLESWLGCELAGAYDGFFDRFGPSPLTSADVNCNWNLGVNAFSENYHTLHLHSHTVPDYQGSPVNPLRHTLALELLQRHARFSTPYNPDHHQRVSEKLAYTYTPPAIPTFISDASPFPPGINFRRVDGWAFDVVELFPNFVMLTGHGWAVELWFWPLSVDRSIFEIAILQEKPKSYSQRIAQEFPLTLNREVSVEDLSTLELQHARLKGKSASVFPLSDQEILLAHHYRVGREMMGVAG